MAKLLIVEGLELHIWWRKCSALASLVPVHEASLQTCGNSKYKIYSAVDTQSMILLKCRRWQLIKSEDLTT